jgi:hypothetical protein
LLAHGQWFSPGTLASSTTKTGRHDIAEILLKVALKHHKKYQLFDKDQIIDIFCGVLTPLSAIFQLYHGDQF